MKVTPRELSRRQRCQMWINDAVARTTRMIIESVAHLLGGQGTINVNSWPPGGTRFAFVAYPIS